MKKYGLIGYPLNHSFSPKYFAEKFQKEGIDAEYRLFPLPTIADFVTLKNSNLSGLNVTIPYKKAILDYLDLIDDKAREVGAVNTIKFEDGKTIGYNTDVYGFKESLQSFIGAGFQGQALILGSGGAAKAVKYVLDDMGIDHKTVSRSGKDMAYAELDGAVLERHKLIINTTPLGMYPHTEACPDIPYKEITEEHFLYDLIYNPEKTLFLIKGTERGARIKNGHEMLTLQAENSWAIWNQI